jgi:TonB family protein
MIWLVSLVLLLLPCTVQGQVLDSPPALEHEVTAAYPSAALTERIEASVLFTIDIDAAGKVSNVTLAEPSEHPGYGFEDAARAAIEQFTFKPALSGGAPVPVRVQYRYRFVLPPTETPAEPAAPEQPTQSVAPAAPPAPAGRLSGRVLERGARSPLAGALIIAQQGLVAFEAITDEQGAFSFYDLAPGPWQLSAETQGFAASRGEERVAVNEQTEVTVYLERTTDNPYDVLVEGDAPKREVTRRRLDVREAASQPGSFGDPLVAVENLPGVAVAPFDAGSISMRGASPDESSIYLDGFRTISFFHYIGLRSIIAPGFLESVDLYPGNAPTNFGRQTGGVLEAKLKRSQPDRLHGYADISLLDAGLFIETPIGEKVSIAAAGRVSYIDKVMRALDAPFPVYDDYQLMVTARPAAAHQLRLFYLGSDDKLELDVEELSNESAQATLARLRTENHIQHVALEHDYAPSTRISNRMRVGFLHWLGDTSFSDDMRIRGNYNTLQLRDTLRFSPRAWITAELGLDAEIGKWMTDVLIAPPPKYGEPEGYVDFDNERRAYKGGLPYYGVGGWASLELKPVRDLLIVPGVRADLQPQVEAVTVDPRITARYQPIDQVAIKAGSGVYHGPPTTDEAASAFGNPKLGAERAFQHSAGVELTPLPFLQLDLTGFYHQLDGLAAQSNKIVEKNGEAVALNYENTGEGRAYGLEVMLRQQLAYRLSGWIAYTLARTERRRVASDAFRVFEFDQTHNLALVAAYQLPRHFQLSTRFRFRTGRPTTPVTGATFVSDNDEYAPAFGATNSRRLDDFHQLDVRLDKRWVFDLWSFTAYVDVQNVYNRNNSLDLTYSYDYSENAKVKGLPLLAIVGFKAEY